MPAFGTADLRCEAASFTNGIQKNLGDLGREAMACPGNQNVVIGNISLRSGRLTRVYTFYVGLNAHHEGLHDYNFLGVVGRRELEAK
jgi:hypothetical protein